MKLNCNYCLIGILVLVILYCCLGPNIFEGLDNKSKSDKKNNHKNNNSQSINSAPTGGAGGARARAGRGGPRHADDKGQLGGRGAGGAGARAGRGAPPTGKVSQTSKGLSLNGQSYDTTDPCDTGMIWNSVTGKCENDDTLSKLKSNTENYDSDISGDVENTMKSLSSDMSNLFNNSTSQTPSDASNFIGTPSPTTMPVSRSQIPPGKEDQYILKSEIVPPVCPACPPQLACPSKAKCPPCPPCARCPESPFTCKKVPDYSSPSVGQILPRPILNDFSQF